LHARYPLNAKVNYGWADPRNLISRPDPKIRELSGGLRVSIGVLVALGSIAGRPGH